MKNVFLFHTDRDLEIFFESFASLESVLYYFTPSVTFLRKNQRTEADDLPSWSGRWKERNPSIRRHSYSGAGKMRRERRYFLPRDLRSSFIFGISPATVVLGKTKESYSTVRTTLAVLCRVVGSSVLSSTTRRKIRKKDWTTARQSSERRRSGNWGRMLPGPNGSFVVDGALYK